MQTKHIHRNALILLAAILACLCVCALVRPHEALANPSNELKLTVGLVDRDNVRVDGDKSITVFKNNDTSSYSYEKGSAKDYCRYHYTENTVHWNTYFGQAWSSRTNEMQLDGVWMHWFPARWDKWLEVQLSMAKMLLSRDETKAYEIQLNVPEAYMTPYSFNMKVADTTWLFNPKPELTFTNLDPKYIVSVSVSSDIRGDIKTQMYGTADVGVGLRKKGTKDIKLEVPNLSNYEQGGYKFYLECPDGKTVELTRLEGATDTLVARPADTAQGGYFPIGTYSIVLKRGDETIGAPAGFTLDPMRCPRVAVGRSSAQSSTQDPGGGAVGTWGAVAISNSASANFIQPRLQWGTSLDQADIKLLNDAADRASLGLSLNTPSAYSKKVADAENYWTKANLERSGGQLAEKDPNLSSHTLVWKGYGFRTYAAQKVWSIDSLDTDRPTAVNVALFRCDTNSLSWQKIEGQERRLSEVSWYAEFDPLLVTPANGRTIESTIKAFELDQAGNPIVDNVQDVRTKPTYEVKNGGTTRYRVDYSRKNVNDKDVTTITNTALENDNAKVVVKQVWDDSATSLDNRPRWITVDLKSGTETLSRKSIATPRSGPVNVDSLYVGDQTKYVAGSRRVYTVAGGTAAGYTTTIAEHDTEGASMMSSELDHFTITNKWSDAQQTITFNITKKWDVREAPDAYEHPDAVQVKILADGQPVKDSADANKDLVVELRKDADKEEWHASVASLPKFNDGREVDYTAQEQDFNGSGRYKTTYDYQTNDNDVSCTITNAYQSKKDKVNVTAVWEDDDDEDKVRPRVAYVELKKNDERYGYVQLHVRNNCVGSATILNEDDLSTFTLNKVPDGTRIAGYGNAVQDVEGRGYTTKIEGNATDGYVVTFTRTSKEKQKMDVAKTWDIDAEGKDKPASIKVQLQRKKVTKDGQGNDKTTWEKVDGIDDLVLNDENQWKGSFEFYYQDNETAKNYRIRELTEGDSPKPVYGTSDADKPEDYKVPTVTYTVQEAPAQGGGQEGQQESKSHKTKYFVTYETNDDGDTTITNTAVMDTSIFKRWFMLGDSQKPDYVYLMLMGRIAQEQGGGGAAPAAGEQKIPYVPVYNALYGDTLTANDIADAVGLKDQIQSVSDLTTGDKEAFAKKIDDYVAGKGIGLAVAKAKANDNILTSWRVAFGVRKYDQATGQKMEYLGAELVTGLMKVGTDTLTGFDFPVMLQPIPQMYLTVFGKAYHIPVIDNDHELTANVINTWYKGDSDPSDSQNPDPGNPPAPADPTIPIPPTPTPPTPGRGEGDKTIGGVKYWVGDDGTHPQSVTIHVYEELEGDAKREVLGSPVTTDAANYWAWTLNVPDGGTYSVEEEVPAGYEATYYDHNVVNTWKENAPPTTKIGGTKVWDDDNDAAGARPESVTIRLSGSDGKTYKRVVTAKNALSTDANAWQWSFVNLPAGVTYDVTEDTIEGYDQPQITGNAQSGFVVTNKLSSTVPEYVSVDGFKTWDDLNDAAGKRPKSITINLLADGEKKASKTVTASDGWKWSFNRLPKYKEGSSTEEVVYTITEDEVASYDSEVHGYNVTNTLKDLPDKSLTYKCTKVWQHNNNEYGDRPQSITIRLKADGAEVMSRTVTAADDWKCTFSGLPQDDVYGKNISYTITEDDVPLYKTTIGEFTWSDNNEYSCTIENEYDNVDKADIRVTKVWDDDNNRDEVRPNKVTVHLKKDGQDVEGVDLTENNWSYTFTNLDRDANYTVTEDAVPGYEEPQVSGDATQGFTIINSHSPQTTSVRVTKVWDDDNNASGKRPRSVTLKLLADSEDTGRTCTVSEVTGWSWTFTDLPKYRFDGLKDGQQTPVSYYVDEVDVPEGYSKTVSGNNTQGFTITNTLSQPSSTQVHVTKAWEDEYNWDGLRPESVKIRLLANGAEVAAKDVGWSDDWQWTFQDLPKTDQDGKDITYTVSEDKVAGYDDPQIAGNAEDGFVVTNVHEPKATNVSVAKVWDDNNNESGKRPDAVTVRLHLFLKGYPDFIYEYDSAEVSEANDWRYEFTDLPEYVFGMEAGYTVTEDEVSGYTTAVSGDAASGFTITNTLKPTEQTVTVEGAKTWFDEDDESKRPKSITIYLLSNGSVLPNNIKTVTAADNWSWKFEGLPKFDKDGKEIEYGIAEGAIDGYYGFVDGYNVYNALERHVAPQTISLEGEKLWDDEGHEDERPASITVYLLANGEVVASKEVSAQTGWRWPFSDLPVYNEADTLLDYTVIEGDVVHYQPQKDGPNIVNVYTPEVPSDEKVTIEGEKQWDDSGHEGERPESVTVYLLANGEVVASKEVSALTQWRWSFPDMPKRYGDTDIAYTVLEGDVKDYAATIAGDAEAGFVITNTFVPDTPSKTVSVAGEKTWNDDNAKDSRPDKITVYLLADGIIVDSREVTEADGWKWEFKDLPAEDDTGETVYTVAEGALEGYTATYDGHNITNTPTSEPEPSPKPEVVTVAGAKTWDDRGHEDARPLSITIYLMANGTAQTTKTVTAADGWKWEFADLPAKDADGKEIVYTIAEGATEGYTSKVDGFNVTNRFVLPARHDPPVRKVLTGDEPATPATFTFVLTAGDKANPMPDGKTGGSKEMTIEGAGEGEFGVIEFARPGTYEYTVTEKDDGREGYTYDTTPWTIRYEVAPTDADGDGYLDCTRTFLREGKVVENMTAATFTNDYRLPDTPTEPTEPTTPTTPTTSGGTPSAGTTTTTTRQSLARTGDPSLAFALPTACAGVAALLLARRRRL